MSSLERWYGSTQNISGRLASRKTLIAGEHNDASVDLRRKAKIYVFQVHVANSVLIKSTLDKGKIYSVGSPWTSNIII